MVALTVDLDVLVHNSGNNWGAPFEKYVLFVFEAANNSLIWLGFVYWV
jgi:hypothetical protein